MGVVLHRIGEHFGCKVCVAFVRLLGRVKVCESCCLRVVCGGSIGQCSWVLVLFVLSQISNVYFCFGDVGFSCV